MGNLNLKGLPSIYLINIFYDTIILRILNKSSVLYLHDFIKFLWSTDYNITSLDFKRLSQFNLLTFDLNQCKSKVHYIEISYQLNGNPIIHTRVDKPAVILPEQKKRSLRSWPSLVYESGQSSLLSPLSTFLWFYHQ